MTTKKSINSDALKMTSFQVFSKLEGAVTSGMIHLGDRLGLYEALAKGEGDTSESLALKLSLMNGGCVSGFTTK